MDDVLESQEIPSHICKSERSTLESIHNSKPEELAAFFLFGRENLIPDLFRGLVNQINQDLAERFTFFEYYLQRHIEIDDDHHGPMDEEPLSLLCGTDEAKWESAGRTAKSTLANRHQFWDGISESLVAL